MNKKYLSALALVSIIAAAPLAYAEVEDPIVLRVRWLIVAPDVSSSPISTIGGTASVDTNITPEIDVSYFFTRNIAVELISAVTRHRARANGTAAGNLNLGEVSLLPPTLTLQWHFLPENIIAPYIGAGLNYTYFFGVNPGPVARHIEYEDNFGGVLQAGVNLNFCPQWHINLDVKKIFVDTNATVQLAAPPVLTSSIDINPLIVGIGIGYRFG